MGTTKSRGLNEPSRSVVEGLILKRWELGTLTAVCALAFSMEQADTGVLQSMYGPIARGLSCSAVQIGTLTTWRGVVQVRHKPSAGRLSTRHTTWNHANGGHAI